MITKNTPLPLPSGAKRYMYMRYGFVGSVLIVAGLKLLFGGEVITDVANNGMTTQSPISGSMLALFLIFSGAVTILFTYRWCKHYTYTITDSAVTLRSGAFIPTEKTLEFLQIQVIERRGTYIQGLFNVVPVSLWRIRTRFLEAQAERRVNKEKISRPNLRLFLTINDSLEFKRLAEDWRSQNSITLQTELPTS